jgi:TolB-like protein/Flp pilus assembly protein TadD
MAEGGGDQEASGKTLPVFISYASQDAAVANSIVENLEQHGLRCWLAPRDVKPGALYADAIVGALNEAKALVLVLSGSAVTSSHVSREVERAASKRKPMIAFRIDAAPLSRALEYFLGESQWIDVRALGMPAALAKLAEAVGQGLGQTVAADPAASAKPLKRTGGRAKLIVGASVVISVGLAVALGVHFWSQSHRAAQPAAAVAITDKSVAVLPFVDMSEKKDQEYFSDGLSEELIDLLTKIPNLQVPARTSSFYFKGKQATVADIAKALSVSHVLEGSVRKSGNKLRITAQLIRVDNGYHLWSETYDRELDDIFKIQDEIAAAVVAALKVTLLGSRAPRVTPTVNTEAYTLYLQAQALGANAAQLADLERAISLVKRALELDPRFASAWALLAGYRAYTWTYYTHEDYQQVLDEAHHFAQRALELDPTLSEAHLAMAAILIHQWDWGSAASEINQALALDPGNADASGYAAEIALVQGRSDEAVELAQKLVALDPLVAWNYGTLGNALLASGRPAEAETAWRRAVDLAPTMSQLRFCFAWALLALHKPAAALDQMAQEVDERYRNVGLALALDALGRKEEADRALAAAEANYARVVEYPIAAVYANRNDPDQAFKWLDLACELHDGWAWWIPWDPLLKRLRADPRYRSLLRKINAVA